MERARGRRRGDSLPRVSRPRFTYRGGSVRRPLDQWRERFHGAHITRGRVEKGGRGPIQTPPRVGGTGYEAADVNRHIQVNFRHHDTSIPAEKSDRLVNHDKKRSFRDLFSKEDVDRGGNWEEVRRRKAKVKTDPPPLIPYPCYRCGLGGHIRRYCPSRFNMRCYGCGSINHLLRNCPTSNRPEEAKVELDSVFDINDRVQILNNFAIYNPISGTPTEHSLSAAVASRFWELGWKGRVIPIGRGSFMVGFPSVFQRDKAVSAGKVDMGDFKGIFHAWKESLGSSKIFRPMFIWLKLVGLPLHLWGREEIEKVVGSFGKLRQLSENFFSKSSADDVRVMVEVEDVSIIPKVVKCSYKAISDDAYRFFDVKIVPSSQCIPLSQLNPENFQLFEQGGGLSDTVEERWSNGSEAGPGVARAVELMVAEKNKDADAGEAEVADLAQHTNAEAKSVADVQEFSNPVHAPRAFLSTSEKERQRKGKGPLIEEPFTNWADNEFRPTNYSGSDSCDPIQQHDHVQAEAESQDADSHAGPVKEVPKEPSLEEGREKVGSVGGSVDMEISSDEMKKTVVGQGAGPDEQATKVVEAVSARVEEESKEEDRRISSIQGERKVGVSRGSTQSVPPGFKRISSIPPRSSSGPASPFGKFQRGGFKHLKRPASYTAGLKSGNSSSSIKKNKPIAAMSEEAMQEVAQNVGVRLPLTEEQITYLRTLEKGRAEP